MTRAGYHGLAHTTLSIKLHEIGREAILLLIDPVGLACFEVDVAVDTLAFHRTREYIRLDNMRQDFVGG